jgi:2-succinyl-6-hydroxy-2,4-cyclohexadiene-1-carboxylate synthase
MPDPPPGPTPDPPPEGAPVHRDLAEGRHHGHLWNADAAGPPVLALHGFTGSGADWAPIATALPSPVLAPDLLGHGGSPAPAEVAPYRIERVVGHALAWCEGAPSWVVVGYSMGGRVALRLAEALGDRLLGLVLISASPGIADDAARARRAAEDGALADQIEARGVPWFAERWSRHPIIRSQQDIPEVIRGPMQARRRRNRTAGLAGSLRGMGQGAVAPVWDRLPHLRVPTLWITGDDDARYTAMVARAAARVPTAEHLRVPRAGHCTHLEAPAPVLAALRRFLVDVTPAAGR